LKEDRCIGCALGVREQTLKLIQTLLTPQQRPVKLANLVRHSLTLALERGKLALQLGPIPEKAQKPVIFDRFATGQQLLSQGQHARNLANSGRQAVEAIDSWRERNKLQPGERDSRHATHREAVKPGSRDPDRSGSPATC
jgi:hypothetical protein